MKGQRRLSRRQQANHLARHAWKLAVLITTPLQDSAGPGGDAVERLDDGRASNPVVAGEDPVITQPAGLAGIETRTVPPGGVRIGARLDQAIVGLDCEPAPTASQGQGLRPAAARRVQHDVSAVEEDVLAVALRDEADVRARLRGGDAATVMNKSAQCGR